jgi:hypothetical protein
MTVEMETHGKLTCDECSHIINWIDREGQIPTELLRVLTLRIYIGKNQWGEKFFCSKTCLLAWLKKYEPALDKEFTEATRLKETLVEAEKLKVETIVERNSKTLDVNNN